MKEYILMVDDSPTVRAAAEFILKEAGYNIATAINGLDGLKKLEAIHADGNKTAMIISDINMPEMDGFTFIKVVKKTPFKDIPILVMTTESQQSKKEEGKEAGAIGWLTKPFTPKQLIKVIDKFVKAEDDAEEQTSEKTMDSLLLIFHDEMIPQLHTIKETINELKNDINDKESINQLIKQLHYIRSSAHLIGCPDICKLAYLIEVAAYKHINGAGVTASEESIDILLKGLDVVKKMIKNAVILEPDNVVELNKERDAMVSSIENYFN